MNRIKEFFTDMFSLSKLEKKISSLLCSNGITVKDESSISNEIISFYKNLLGSHDTNYIGGDQSFLQSLLTNTVPSESQAQLIQEVTDDEILKVIKGMPKNISPGPDGYTSESFIVAWEIVGKMVISTVNEFVQSNKLLKQINSTIIALVANIQHPTMISEFRPISYCNIIYKCIAKILENRLKLCLPSLISWNQPAFVQGRRIIDNILLAHEVIKDYHKPIGKPRCTIKIDIKKAFDSIH